MTLQLFKDGNRILGSDGVMYADGRLSTGGIIQKIIERNKRYEDNFPNKIAEAFAIYAGEIGGSISSIQPISSNNINK